MRQEGPASAKAAADVAQHAAMTEGSNAGIIKVGEGLPGADGGAAGGLPGCFDVCVACSNQS